MKHHPDKNIGKDGAAEQFREVSDAYQVLSNAESKQQYDSELGRKSDSYRSILRFSKYGWQTH